MRKPKPFSPNEKNYEIFLQWVEEMKKINKIPKGAVSYNAKVNELFTPGTEALPSFNDNDDNNHMIPQVFVVNISYTREYTDPSAFVFHFGKRYGAITAWCKNGSDEEHNKPLVKLWDAYWDETYPDEDMDSKFTTTKLWGILTGFISYEQNFSPLG
ncbi:MAG: hypothetical protein WCL18_02190 [bacterium]